MQNRDVSGVMEPRRVMFTCSIRYVTANVTQLVSEKLKVVYTAVMTSQIMHLVQSEYGNWYQDLKVHLDTLPGTHYWEPLFDCIFLEHIEVSIPFALCREVRNAPIRVLFVFRKWQLFTKSNLDWNAQGQRNSNQESKQESTYRKKISMTFAMNPCSRLVG